ncbi:hypothetical protein SAMN04488527_1137 [Aliiroseovarius crassostreae]|nr:hypothetical protein SAMN04488527_1137 [Aliiroseovarius crassostreae]
MIQAHYEFWTQLGKAKVTDPLRARNLVGCRHPHRRARSGPLSGVSCGPRACRVRVPISCGRFGYSASGGGADAISVMA